MRVILKQNVENLGRKGDIVNVAPGYGRNYLIPKKIALEVTSSNMKMIEIEQKSLQKAVEKERASFQGVIDTLNETTLSFKRKAGEKDVIFGSVSSSDIKDALQELNIEIDKKKILLDEPIKRLGNYTVPIKIFHEDRAEVKVEVITEEEGATEKPEEKKVKEETPEEAEVAKIEPEKEDKEKELEKQEEKIEDKEKIKEKEDKAEEEKAAPEIKEEEAEAKQKKEEGKEEISGEKTEEAIEKGMPEEVQEDIVQEQEEAPEKKAEEVGEEVEEPEKKDKKDKKDKKEKKEKKE
jgi:large subunit ribosomal protein L9